MYGGPGGRAMRYAQCANVDVLCANVDVLCANVDVLCANVDVLCANVLVTFTRDGTSGNTPTRRPATPILEYSYDRTRTWPCMRVLTSRSRETQ